MRRCSIGILMAAFCLVATVVASAQPATASPLRYVDPLFSAFDVDRDVVYGTALNTDGVMQDLTMDIYRPQGDTETDRPLVVWVHGGSFIDGDKSSMANHAQYLAARGYVTASINYRVRPDAHWSGTSISDVMGDFLFLQSVYQAFADTRTSVAWLQDHAGDYGIDPDRVAVGGYSAGAVTALNHTFLPQRWKGQGLPSEPAYARGFISLAGTTVSNLIEVGEGPIFMAHGTRDTTVRYAEGAALCAGAIAKSVPCELHSYDTTHNLSPFLADIQARYTAFLYEWVVNPSPRIDQLSPARGPTAGGTSVTITGSGLTGATAVQFGAAPAVAHSVDSDWQLTAVAPPGTSPLVSVSVTTPHGTSAPTARTLFAYDAPPTISSITPGQGPIAGGQTATITGSGFTGTTAVTFGGVAAPFTLVDPSTLSVTVPPHAAGQVHVAVTARGGTNADGITNSYDYVGATVTGSVRSTAGAVAGVYVGVSPADHLEITTYALTDASGAFTLLDIPGGTYRMLVLDPAQFADPPTDHFISRFAGGGTSLADFATAPTFVATEGLTTEQPPIVLDHSNPGSLAGVVTDGTAPLGGMAILVSPAAAPTLTASVLTAADGSFTVSGLAPGTYRLATIDPAMLSGSSSYYLPQLYDDQGSDLSSFETASVLTVVAGTETPVAPIALVHN